MTEIQELEFVGYGPNGDRYFTITKFNKTVGWLELDSETKKYYFEGARSNVKLLTSNDYRVIVARLDDLNGKGAA